MTPLGKVLVFFNLVFSLVVGAFGVMAYTARTHYAKNLDDMGREFATLNKSRDAYKDEADRLAGIYEKLKERIRTEAKTIDFKDGADPGTAVLDAITRSQEKAKALAARIEKLEKDIKQQTDKAAEAHAGLVAAQGEVLRREADVKQARQAYSDQVKANIELLDKMKQARDNLVKAEIGKKAAMDRLEDQDKDLKDLRAQLQRMRSGKGSATRPPENVEGLVKQIDQSKTLLTITLGSDAGLAKGHRLYVFRLGRTPLYLGEVEMVEVGRAQSVAQVVKKGSQPIRENDRVGTSIVGGN